MWIFNAPYFVSKVNTKSTTVLTKVTATRKYRKEINVKLVSPRIQIGNSGPKSVMAKGCSRYNGASQLSYLNRKARDANKAQCLHSLCLQLFIVNSLVHSYLSAKAGHFVKFAPRDFVGFSLLPYLGSLTHHTQSYPQDILVVLLIWLNTAFRR